MKQINQNRNHYPIIEPDPILRAAGYVSIATAAALLQVSPKTIQKYINLGRIASQLSGNRRVMLREDVQNFTPPANGRPRKDVK